MKKYISLLLCFVLLLGMTNIVCYAGDNEYWSAQKNYQAAVSSGDNNAILKAVKQIEAAYTNPKNEAQYSRVAFPVQKAAIIYEQQGKYDDAVTYYKKFLQYVTWLNNNTSADYSFFIKSIPAVIEHLSVQPEVYVATANDSLIPYFGSKYEPKLGTYFGTCNKFTEGEESAFLLYVLFGDENISDFAWRIPETNTDYVLEIAWNLKKESLAGLKEVNSTKFDEYVDRNVEYLSGLKGKVILRFAAEVNCWEDNTNYPKEMISEFKKAYTKIAKKVRANAPNVALVYSVTEFSNLNVSVKDFYPGDKYVDWVGIASYQNISKNAQNTVNSSDAFYGRGHYEDMMVKIKPIIDAFGSKKPIMISECGFAYKDKSGLQTQTHAVQKLKEFYSYVNCVYPQVKLVLYFDTSNANVSANEYALEGNAAILKAYNETVAGNAAMQGTLHGNKPMSYTKIDAFAEKANTLDLKIYASYPSHKKTTVTVKVDGKTVLSSSSAPYSININTDKWAAKVHTITVTAKSGNTSRTVIKCIDKSSSGKITCIGSLRDVAVSHWAKNYIEGCLQEKIFKGVSFTTFEPDSVMTRAMFVQVLANISGANLSSYKVSSFKDVKNNAWYCKAVMWAYKNKIVSGVGNGKFEPEAIVTREQMCSMLNRYAKTMGITMPKTAFVTKFADQSQISKWAIGDVQACQKAGLISGEKKNGKYYFNPQGGATRAQASKIFCIFSKF